MAFPIYYIPHLSNWWDPAPTLTKPCTHPQHHLDTHVGSGAHMYIGTGTASIANPDIEAKYKEAVDATGVSHITYDSDKYQARLDVSHFKPEELCVKVDDNCILIEGHHDETQDEHGYVTRSFKRKYILPSDITPESLTASISTDGVLHLEAPRPKHEHLAEKLIPIQQEESTTTANAAK